MLAKITLLIILWMVWLFSSCSYAHGANIYLNHTDIDIQLQTNSNSNIPIMFIFDKMMNKNVNFYIWTEKNNNGIIETLFLGKDFKWKNKNQNQFQAVLNMNKVWSSFWNINFPYTLTQEIDKLVLYVCVMENNTKQIFITPSTVKILGQCGVKNLQICNKLPC